MIVEIEHIMNNKFAIKVNGELKYLAGKTWINMKLPSSDTYIITTSDDKLLYFSKRIKVKNYDFLDINNNLNCKINKQEIDFQNHKFTCHEKATGTIANISIYDGDKQISQIVLPQQNGKIYIFLLEKYKNLDAIISFYTVLGDCLSLWDRGEVFGRHEVGFKYTYSKDDNKYYNENWVTDNFDKVKVDNIYNEINANRQVSKEKYKNQSKKILLFVGLGWLLLLIIAIIVFILK